MIMGVSQTKIPLDTIDEWYQKDTKQKYLKKTILSSQGPTQIQSINCINEPQSQNRWNELNH